MMRSGAAAVLLMVVLGAFGKASAQDQKLPNPVLNPGAPWAFTGFTIDSPARIEGTAGWYSLVKTPGSTALGAARSPSHTFSVIVRTVVMPQTASDASGLATILRETTPSSFSSNRYSVQQYTETPDSAKGVCSRSARQVMDKGDGGPNFSGSWFVISTLTCVYPHRPDAYVAVEYSERGGAEDFSPVMREVGDKVLSSFRFMKIFMHPEMAAIAETMRRGDHAAIRSTLTPIASAGDGFAALHLGDSYYLVKGEFKDLAAARKWYEIAAAQGFSEAQYSLASILDLAKETDRVMDLYRRASDQRHADAQFSLAFHTMKGTGGVKNERFGRDLMRMAADNGSSFAQRVLQKTSQNK